MVGFLLASLVACESFEPSVAALRILEPALEADPSLQVDDANDGRVFCDIQKRLYCEQHMTCCPFPNGFGCAKDPAATCDFDTRTYCPHTVPIICGHGCCPVKTECVAGACRSLRTLANGAALESAHALTDNLGWLPARNTAVNREFERDLHDIMFPHIADLWRRDGAQQCWVIGYPGNLDKCHKPFDSGCQGKESSLQMRDPMVIVAQTVATNPILEQSITWCNDDPNKTEEQTFAYSHSYSNTYAVSLTAGVSVEVDVSSEVGVDMKVMTAKETLSLKTKIDVSTTRSQTTTKIDAYSTTQKIYIGPHSRVHSRCWINAGILNAKWSARVHLSGNVVWACSTSDPRLYIVTNPKEHAWDMDTLRELFKSQFGLDDDQCDQIWTKEIHGEFKGVHGFDVQCSTHTDQLKDGETCKVAEERSDAATVAQPEVATPIVEAEHLVFF